MKNLQKEIRSQEKLAQQISEKTAKLKKSKETAAMYKKWLKQFERLEQQRLKHRKKLDEQMQAALEKTKEREEEKCHE